LFQHPIMPGQVVEMNVSSLYDLSQFGPAMESSPSFGHSPADATSSYDSSSRTGGRSFDIVPAAISTSSTRIPTDSNTEWRSALNWINDNADIIASVNTTNKNTLDRLLHRLNDITSVDNTLLRSLNNNNLHSPNGLDLRAILLDNNANIAAIATDVKSNNTTAIIADITANIPPIKTRNNNALL